jgi:hypothetical protein
VAVASAQPPASAASRPDLPSRHGWRVDVRPFRCADLSHTELFFAVSNSAGSFLSTGRDSALDSHEGQAAAGLGPRLLDRYRRQPLLRGYVTEAWII